MVRRILPALLSLILLPMLAATLHAQNYRGLPEIPADTSRSMQDTTQSEQTLGGSDTTISNDAGMPSDTMMGIRTDTTISADTLFRGDATTSGTTPTLQQGFASSPAESSSPIYVNPPGRSSRLGFYAAADYTFQEAKLQFATPSGAPSGANCHCAFEQGDGPGYIAGLSMSLGFNNDRWWQTTRITYASRTAHSSFTDTALIYKPAPDPPDLEISTEDFNLNFQMINTELLFSYALGSKGFFVTGGISAGFLVGHSYAVTVSVAEVEYKPSSGKLDPVENFTTSLLGGGGMRLRLGRESRTMIQPEILFTYPLEEISRKYRWDFKSIRAGVTMLIEL